MQRGPRAVEPGAYDAAMAAFQRAYPDYDAERLDALRAREYGRLDEQGQVYLDYTGGSLYGASQLREHLHLLQRGVYGNPHSANPTSRAATDLAEEARGAVLDYFRAPRDEYTAIFTANASAALKLVGEAYPFVPEGTYLLTTDNHNSVNGIREFARARGARVTYIPLAPNGLAVPADRLMAQLDLEASSGGARRLFAFPAQSNFSGAQHPLAWVAAAQARGWDVLLDAAAFAPTNRLDLRRWRPDFVALSFYKLFGYPTGVGCLLARRETLARLRRPWFAGGTVAAASVRADGHFLAPGETAFEDGTISYLTLPAVTIGLRYLQQVGVEAIHTRVRSLTGWLLDQLPALRHRSGIPLVRLYGPATTDHRGATLALNLQAPDGAVLDCTLVEGRANRAGISLRSGCFCNPGASEVALSLTREVLAPIFHQHDQLTAPHYRRLLAEGGAAAGAVRISLGIATTFADVYELVQFLRGFLEPPAQRRA